MNKELNTNICECYNYNVGTALNLLFNCIDTESNLNRLEAAKKLIEREVELERFEYSFNPRDYNLPNYFDDLRLDYPKNIDNAIYHLYGYYNKNRLLKCLEYIENEIEITIKEIESKVFNIKPTEFVFSKMNNYPKKLNIMILDKYDLHKYSDLNNLSIHSINNIDKRKQFYISDLVIYSDFDNKIVIKTTGKIELNLT